MYKKFIRNIAYRIEDFNNSFDLNAYFIGNSSPDSFQNLFEYSEHIESFISPHTLEIQRADTLIVSGPINKNIVGEIKELYNSLRGEKKYVIYVSGPIKESILKKSYFAETDLKSHLPIDLEYRKSPIQLEEFLNDLKQLKREL